MTEATALGVARGMIPEDLFRIRWLTDAQLSPGGETVAFVVTLLDQAEDDYRSTIWLAPVTGGEPEPFTRGPRRDSAPRWSPDGGWLAFVAQRAEQEQAQLYLMPAHGGEARRLTSEQLGVAAPVWAPDSRGICVVGKVSTIAEQPEGSKQAPRARVITTLKYKYDGEGFTYDRRKHLYVVDLDGTARQITDGDWNDDEPCWSPDGRQIAFVSARGEERDYSKASDLLVVAAAGGEPEQWTNGSFAVSAPAWSPDGATIAFLGHNAPEDTPRHTRLWTIQHGGAPRCLTMQLDLNLGAGSGIVWSPDGAAIYVLAHERGSVPLLRVDAASGAVSRVLGSERGATSFTLDASGARIAFAASTSERPAEVFLAAADGSDQRRLTRLNDGFSSDASLPAPRRLSLTGPDGSALDAWLLRPANYQPGVSHPLLLNIHGGPFAQYGSGFHDEFQVQAGAGFGVLYGNYRGSSGYGEAYARAIIGEPAIKESEDVLAALDYALAHCADIDRERLGILGGSYGGYLTSWIIGHDDRFAAACSERGISNRLSKAGTDDINTSWAYFRTEPWRDPELFLRLSPLMFVEAMRTPLLIMQSEEDLRCPMEQAEQLFTALKRLRRDVTLVRFPGENHELSRTGKPSHRLQRFQIQLEFFAARLGVAAHQGEAVAAD